LVVRPGAISIVLPVDSGTGAAFHGVEPPGRVGRHRDATRPTGIDEATVTSDPLRAFYTTGMNDAAWISRVLDGDTEAFSTLVDRYDAECFRFARHMLGHGEDAEDAVQETFVRAYRALGRYDERHAFRSWLFRILVNQCRTIGRARGRFRRRFVQNDEAIASAPSTAGLEAPELREPLAVALAELDPELREAFLLKHGEHGEDMDYAAIASVTGVGISALKMRVKRARDRLRPRLEELLRE
jgi:RNA polymerase sigma-70 factor (ECF subfamily)